MGAGGGNLSHRLIQPSYLRKLPRQ